ncbi:MAG TPA: metal-dependent hydrolase [Flavobacteriaceae bacterium]|nr:metal-dependent hydrolase [Flavobacteriaceae bacterium]
MDSFTQIVLGAAVGEAALGKKVGNKALLYGAIAGTIPDLDILSGFFVDTVTALEIHRGFTHSILFAVFGGMFFGWLVSLWEKRASWKQWSWLFFLGFITHSWLDAHTSWGTQIFWPFGYQVSFRNIFVIDPLYTIPFAIFLLLAWISPVGSSKRARYNWWGIGISSAYMLVTIVLKFVTYDKFVQALDEQGVVYSTIQTKPSPMNTILWTANVQTEDAFLIGDYSFFDTEPIQFYSHPKNHELLSGLRDNKDVQRLITVTEDKYTVVKKEDGIYLNDLRFGMISVKQNGDKYAFSYKLEEVGDEIIITEEVKDREDAKRMLSDLWSRLLGRRI